VALEKCGAIHAPAKPAPKTRQPAETENEPRP
jgi:hypothetical protein